MGWEGWVFLVHLDPIPLFWLQLVPRAPQIYISYIADMFQGDPWTDKWPIRENRKYFTYLSQAIRFPTIIGYSMYSSNMDVS